MASAKFVVFTIAQPGRRDELDRWYREQHVPDLLRVPGVVGAERFDLSVVKSPPGTPQWDFQATYHLDGDIDVILSEMKARMGTDQMPGSEALDSSKTFAVVATAKPS